MVCCIPCSLSHLRNRYLTTGKVKRRVSRQDKYVERDYIE